MSIATRSALRARAVLPIGARSFSNSIEEIEAGLEHVKRHRNVVQKSTMPTTFSRVHGPGTDLHVPKNMTELSVFSGQPDEHRARTVVIAPRILKTLQSGTFLTSYEKQSHLLLFKI